MGIKLSKSTGGNYIREAGKNVLLQITHAKYDQEFGKVEMTLANERGETMKNNFNLLNADESTNEKALNAFSFFAKTAIGDWDRDEIEDYELVGCYVRGDIKLNEGSEKNKDGETMYFANLDKVYRTDDTFTKSKVKETSSEDEDFDDEEVEDEDWD